ncbi:MAG: DivIVA domain-containing protein [Acidobacteria bacterium]|nr:DivIVA domain-containing protein [Acidobacteriota bacterium]
MRITPLDIQGHEFKKAMRGLDAEEVKAFLSLVAEEYEKLVVANTRLTDEVAELRDRLGDLKERERILKETLYTAQKLADDMKAESVRERDLLLKEAELKADRLLEHAGQRVSQLEAQILDLRVERDAFESKIRSVIEQHTKLLDMRKEEEDVSGRLRFMTRRERREPGA